MTQTFQMYGTGPEVYARFLVPAFFEPCAERLLELAAVGPGERVLDLACGTGVVARGAAARAGSGGRVVGVDLNEDMLAVASSGPRTGVEWRVGDAAAIPLPDAAVDVACCQHGLQFFPDPSRAMGEIRRVLIPGGRLALAVWRGIDHHPVFARLVEALDQHVGAEAAAMMGGPFAGPGRDALRALLEGAGLHRGSIRIDVLAARFPSPREFLRRELGGTPLAGPVGELDEHRLAALVDRVELALEPYVDDEGLLIPMQTWLVTGTRPAAG